VGPEALTEELARTTLDPRLHAFIALTLSGALGRRARPERAAPARTSPLHGILRGEGSHDVAGC
jgi:hypothetical protein